MLNLVLCVELSIHGNHGLIVAECPGLLILTMVLAGIFKHPLSRCDGQRVYELLAASSRCDGLDGPWDAHGLTTVFGGFLAHVRERDRG